MRRRWEGVEPADSRYATEFEIAPQAYRLQPTEDLFDSLPLPVADRVASVSRGQTVNRTGSSRHVLNDMRRQLAFPHRRGVVVAIAP